MAAARRLLIEAFGRIAEADLVENLRQDGDMVLEVVGLAQDGVAGYAGFSKMTAAFPALGLAPVATALPHRRMGVASATIRWGLAQAAREDWRTVFVLGDPAYYGRLGFDAKLAARFSSPYAGRYFMALPFRDDLPLDGAVDYAAAFQRL